MKSPRPVPTDLELELLKVIWERGEATVREVYLELAGRRKIAYTTVLTIMGVLERKGHLRKSRGERAYVYRPTEKRDEVVANMVSDFIGRVFNGSAKPLLMHLVENPDIPAEDLREIEKLARARRKKE